MIIETKLRRELVRVTTLPNYPLSLGSDSSFKRGNSDCHTFALSA